MTFKAHAFLGMDEKDVQKMVKKLNHLLANYSVFYQNVRGMHWNIQGKSFFELHTKFEELYSGLFQKIDDIAERILTLGGVPNHNFSQYISDAKLKESKHLTQGKECVENILSTYQSLLAIQRDLLELSDKIGDEGTNALMSDYISEQEKEVWMYASFLK